MNATEPESVRRLREVHASCRAVRKRVSGGLLAVGFPSSTAGVVLCIWTFYQGIGTGGEPNLDSKQSGSFFYALLFVPGFTMSLLSIVPADAPLIRGLGDLIFTMSTLLVLWFAFAVTVTIRGHFAWREMTCSEQAPFWCWALIYSFTGWVVGFGLILALNVANHRTKPGAPIRYSPAYYGLAFKSSKAFRAEHGTARFCALFVCMGVPGMCPGFWIERAGHGDNIYLHPARKTLQNDWLGYRCFGVFSCLHGLVMAIVESHIFGWGDLDGISFFVFSALTLVVMALVPSHHNRRYVRARLQQLAQTAEEREASTVGALLGSTSTIRAIELATRSFCSIEWSLLRAVDFAGHIIHLIIKGEGGVERGVVRAWMCMSILAPISRRHVHMAHCSSAHLSVRNVRALHAAGPHLDRQRQLRNLAQPTELGECDAFVSHSW